MNDKDKNFLVSHNPLILKKEILNPLVLKEEIGEALVLNKEIDLDYNNEKNINSGIMKINNLLKMKYFPTKKNTENLVKSNFEKDFISIKDTAREINKDIKEKTLLINDSIKSQKEKIKLLYQEKKSLDDNRLEFNENKNKIQTDIIDNQQKLIENNKKDINQFKCVLDDLEKKLKETTLKNRSLEINNKELKNTISKYIVYSKKIDKESRDIKENKGYNNVSPKTSLSAEQINQINSRIDDRIKYYQEENIRLSGELASFQTKYETISKNFTEVEFEKNSIFKQIQELNNSLNSTNLVDKSFSEENIEENSNRSQISKEISDDELDNNQKSPKSKNNLDTDITDIFN
jgi:hypothetical protein